MLLVNALLVWLPERLKKIFSEKASVARRKQRKSGRSLQGNGNNWMFPGMLWHT
jgi:hypothetical protein